MTRNLRRTALDDVLERHSRRHRRNTNAFFVWMMVSAMVSVLLLGVGVWAVIELVSWITTK